MATIFCYITGSLVVILGFFAYFFAKRNIALIFKILTDSLIAINGVCIYFATKEVLIFATVGTNVVSTIRDICYYHRGNNKVLDSKFVPLGFSIFFCCTLFITYKGPLSILPVVGSVISTISLFFMNQKLVKIGGIVGYAVYITYYSILLPSSNVLTIFSLISACSCLIGSVVGLILIFRNEKLEEINKNNNTIRW